MSDIPQQKGALIQFLRKYLLGQAAGHQQRIVADELTVAAGDLTVTAGDLTVTAGDLTVAGSDSSIAQPEWVVVTAYGAGKTWDFAQHWENYDASTYQVVGFMKDSMGFVHLRGLAKSTDAARGTTIFTLPSGYRPTLTSGFGQRANQTVMGSIYVTAAGAVTIATGETALNGFIWLDGIIFDTR